MKVLQKVMTIENFIYSISKKKMFTLFSKSNIFRGTKFKGEILTEPS